MVDAGYIPPDLEMIFPPLFGHPVLTFFIYALILDFADYWRHRFSHTYRAWYALHALHHAQRQMSFWSDDRNHIFDDLISFLWFFVIGLAIGIPPLQFPLLMLVLRFVESLSHANIKLSFGRLGNVCWSRRASTACTTPRRRRAAIPAITARSSRSGTSSSAPPISPTSGCRPATRRPPRSCIPATISHSNTGAPKRSSKALAWQTPGNSDKDPRVPTTHALKAGHGTKIKKVVLAYSGGLDTSVILRWLQNTYACEVVTFTADLGQGEELEPARKKAEMFGIKQIFIEDLRETFVKDFVFPMFRANALYEGQYLLGTSIARPLIAQRQIEIAEMVGADAVAHGATGKGNDQVRFELGYYALNPNIRVIAPWREWELTSRTRLLEYAEANQIPITKDKRGEAPFSVDANLLHSSSEGKLLEDPAQEPDEIVYQRTISPLDAPDAATEITIDFAQGDAVGINGEALSPATILTRLNEYGKANGIGRLDLVENRFVGMKSRGVYETPGGTILLAAHRAIESITLDREAGHLKDSIMPRYAELIYNGFWFSPERRMLQALIDTSQASVTGTVRLKLYKGNVIVIGRDSPNSLYSTRMVTFEDDAGAYNQQDAAGFIKLNSLRLRLGATIGRRGGAL